VRKALSGSFAAVTIVALLTPAAFASPSGLAGESPRLLERLSGEVVSWLEYRLFISRGTGQPVPSHIKCGGAVDPNGCPTIPSPSCTVNCG